MLGTDTDHITLNLVAALICSDSGALACLYAKQLVCRAEPGHVSTMDMRAVAGGLTSHSTLPIGVMFHDKLLVSVLDIILGSTSRHTKFMIGVHDWQATT